MPAELTAERFVADLVPFVPAGLREEFESVASALDDGIGNGDAIRANIRMTAQRAGGSTQVSREHRARRVLRGR